METVKVIVNYQMQRRQDPFSATSGCGSSIVPFNGDLLVPTIVALQNLLDSLHETYAPEGELLVTDLWIEYRIGEGF